ncbi:hypothetical protein QTP88_020678 [Uroleucon formosanum]
MDNQMSIALTKTHGEKIKSEDGSAFINGAVNTNDVRESWLLDSRVSDHISKSQVDNGLEFVKKETMSVLQKIWYPKTNTIKASREIIFRNKITDKEYEFLSSYNLRNREQIKKIIRYACIAFTAEPINYNEAINCIRNADKWKETIKFKLDRSTSDRRIYFNHNNNKTLVLAVFVDDVKVTVCYLFFARCCTTMRKLSTP